MTSDTSDRPGSPHDRVGPDLGVRRRRGVGVLAGVVGALVLVGVAVLVVVQDRPAGGDDGRPGTAADEPLGLTIRSADGVVTRPDGSTVETGVSDGLEAAVVLSDARVVVQLGPEMTGAREVRVYDADGAMEASYDGGAEVLHGSRVSVAWTGDDGRVDVLASGALEPVSLAAPPRLETDAGFVGYEIDTVDCGRPGTDCSVVLRYDHEQGQLQPGIERNVFLRVAVDGWTELASEPEQGVLDVSADGAARLVSLPDDCVGLRDSDTAAVTARTCDPELGDLEFSPDGEQVVFVGQDGVVVLDRDFQRVRTIPFPPGVTYLEHGWTNAGSLLLVVMVDDPVVPDPDPGGDRPGGLFDWYLVDVPVDGGRATVVEGPVRGLHHDTNLWVWHVSDDADG